MVQCCDQPEGREGSRNGGFVHCFAAVCGAGLILERGQVTGMNPRTLTERRVTTMKAAGVLVCLLVMLLVAGRATGGEAVLLKSRRFVPNAGVSDVLSGPKPVESDRIHVLVQLDDVPSDEQKIALLGAGVKLLSYIPHRAWLSSVSLRRVEKIALLPGVRALAKILPKDKIAPSLREKGVSAYSTTETGQARLAVMFFGDVELGAGMAVVREHGGRILDRSDRDNSVVVEMPVEVLYDLASCDVVKWIDQRHASVDLNDGVRAAIGVNAVQASPYDLAGFEVVIGQWESRHPDPNHVDLIGRVVNVGDGDAVRDHATQVAGTMLGDGSLLADRRYRGMAPSATLVSFHNWDNVAELREQYEQAIDEYVLTPFSLSEGAILSSGRILARAPTPGSEAICSTRLNETLDSHARCGM